MLNFHFDHNGYLVPYEIIKCDEVDIELNEITEEERKTYELIRINIK